MFICFNVIVDLWKYMFYLYNLKTVRLRQDMPANPRTRTTEYKTRFTSQDCCVLTDVPKKLIKC